MTFEGFPDTALEFYEGLEADNSKAYWTDHKPVYDADVRAPLQALLDDLEPEFGGGSIFRPYRDVRFSKDKTPYKTQAAAVVHADALLYVALSASGLYVAGGYYRTETDQVHRLRAAVAEERTGKKLVVVLDALQHKGFATGGDQLKRVPKPWDAEHPRADLLRHKSLTGSLDLGAGAWLHTPAARERVADAWRALRPLNDWLSTNVGAHRDVRQT